MISILMATYNGAEFILPQLESIKNQTVQPREVIILDDCSTDQTVAVVREFIQKNQLQNWLVKENEENKGHYQTFIELARLAKEDYVFFSDQDDIWHENKLEKMLPILQEDNTAMVYCQSDLIDEKDQLISRPMVSGETREVGLDFLLKKWPSGYQTAFKRFVLADILERQYDLEPCFQFHDVLFGMMAGLHGKVYCIDQVLDQHRIHRANVTLSSTSHAFHNSLESRLDYYEKMKARYQVIERSAYEKSDVKAQQIAQQYVILYTNRIAFTKQRKVSAFLGIIGMRQYCNGLRGILSDVVYAYRLHRILEKIVRVKNEGNVKN